MARAIESALDQTGVAVEVIVVDDASTDGTPACVAAFGDRVRYVRLDKQPTSIATTNRGIARARGEYIAVLHHDDYYAPGKIRAQVDVMDRHPTVGLSYSAQRYVGPAGEPLGILRSPVAHHDYVVPGAVELRHLVVQNYINFCNAVVRRSCYATTGDYVENLWVSAEWWMWMQLALRHDVAYVDEVLVSYRIHSANQTLSRTTNPSEYLEQLRWVFGAIWATPDLPDAVRDRYRASSGNMYLSSALLHWFRGERRRAAALLMVVLRTVPPTELPGLLRSAALGPRLGAHLRLLMSRHRPPWRRQSAG